MDIRTKLVFSLVSVALASMLALGLFMYESVEGELSASTRAQLDGLAEFKVESVEGIVSGWHDRVSLVASRTQLRLSLDEFNRSGRAAPRARIQRILDDAVSASPLFRQLAVHDVEGNGVATAESSTGLAPVDPDVVLASESAALRTNGQGTRYRGVTFRSGTPPTVEFTAPLVLDGDALGYVHAILVADEIVQLTANYEGLGLTGETMVVVADAAGAPRALHPLRRPEPVESGRERSAGESEAGIPRRPAGMAVASDGPAARALAGEEALLTGRLVDYRGEAVWAAVRYVPEIRWGIVVKIDEAEQARPIHEFRRDTIRLSLSLAAFAILFGTLLGIRFAQPIHTLAAAADRIRAGELDARSGIRTEDEVGLLARTFDEMAAELESKVALLTEFRRFFDVSLDLMCIASTDGYFKRVNPAVVRELGWSEEELLKRPFVSFVHPDDVDATLAEIEKLAGGTPTIRFENRFLCMDGSYKRLRWNSFPEEETGRLYAIARVQMPKGAEAP